MHVILDRDQFPTGDRFHSEGGYPIVRGTPESGEIGVNQLLNSPDGLVSHAVASVKNPIPTNYPGRTTRSNDIAQVAGATRLRRV